MAKVQEELAKRKREKGQNQGWFEPRFSTSPWLTSLISTLLGPLIIILLFLTFAPVFCTFTQDCFQQAQLFTMAVIHRYEEMH